MVRCTFDVLLDSKGLRGDRRRRFPRLKVLFHDTSPALGGFGFHRFKALRMVVETQSC